MHQNLGAPFLSFLDFLFQNLSRHSHFGEDPSSKHIRSIPVGEGAESERHACEKLAESRGSAERSEYRLK
jgi:hypothetical protein